MTFLNLPINPFFVNIFVIFFYSYDNNLDNNLIMIIILRTIFLSKNWSAKYYQEIKEKLQ